MEVATPIVSHTASRLTPWLKRAMLVALGGVASICAFLAQYTGTPGGTPNWTYVIYGSLAAIVGAAVAFPNPFTTRVERPEPQTVGSGRLLLSAGLLLVTGLVAYAYWSRENFLANQIFTSKTSTWVAFFWLAGIGVALAILWPVRTARDRSDQATRTGWQRYLTPGLMAEVVALIVIIDLAAGFRLWHLSSLPEGMWFDEIDSAFDAANLLHLPFQPFAPGNVGHNPSLYFYLMAFLEHLGGNTIGVVRLTSALFGLLAVGAVYIIGRLLGGPALGLVAATLLAVGQWAVDFSRLGMPNSAAPAMIAISFVAFVMAMRRPGAFWFCLAGILLGFGILTYEGAYLAGGVAIAVTILRASFSGAYRKAAWPGMLLLPVGIIIGALPFLVVFHIDREYALYRVTTVSLSHQYPTLAQFIPALEENIRKHLLMFTVLGDGNGRHNVPGAPMLDTVSGACLLLGVGICLRRIHRWYCQLLLLWLVANMLGGILSLDFEAPQGARTSGAVAPLALIAALPLAALGQWLFTLLLQALDRAGRRRGIEQHEAGTAVRVLSMLIAALVIAIPLGVVVNANRVDYFETHATNMPAWRDMGGLQTIIGRAAGRLHNEGYTVLVDPAVQNDPALNYGAGGFVPAQYDPGVPVQLPVPAMGLALIIPADSADTLAFVQASYPTAQIIPLTPAFSTKIVQANVVLIRPEDADRTIGVTATFGSGAQAQIRTQARGDIQWPAGSSPTTPAEVRATLQISSNLASAPIAIRVVGANKATISIDGDSWPNGRAGTGIIHLGAGNHAFTVHAQGRSGDVLGMEWSAGFELSNNIWTQMPPALLAAPTLPSGGLLGLYYQGPSATGKAVLSRVDRTIYAYYQNPPTNTSFPFAARWLGYLRIQQSGSYGFVLNSSGASSLSIDNAPVTTNNGTETGVPKPMYLTAGLHKIELLYSGSGGYLHCYLTWAPPGQSYQPISPAATWPAHQ